MAWHEDGWLYAVASGHQAHAPLLLLLVWAPLSLSSGEQGQTSQASFRQGSDDPECLAQVEIAAAALEDPITSCSPISPLAPDPTPPLSSFFPRPLLQLPLTFIPTHRSAR